MEKKKEKADLEQLLNTLVQRGWKPFGFRGEETRIEIERNKDLDIQIFKLNWIIIEQHHRISGSLRNLVSKESGLWQFVCENGMTKKMEKNPRGIWINSWAKSAYQSYPVYTMERYEYRLIESALTDEDKLEDFILSNIKLD